MRGLLEERGKINLNKTFDPQKIGMVLCPLCDGKGFTINPKRKCCQNAGDLGLLRKKMDDLQSCLKLRVCRRTRQDEESINNLFPD